MSAAELPITEVAASPPADQRMRGIGLVSIAFIVFLGVDTSAKWLAGQGLPPLEIVFMRYAVHLVLVTAFLLPTRGTQMLRTNALRLELLRGFMLLGTTVCIFIALQTLPLTANSAISFTMPLMVCILSGPLLGERLDLQRWLAIGIGFIGVLIIIRPGTDTFQPAALLALAGTALAAGYFIATKKLAGVDSPSTQQFYSALVATICIAPFAFGSWVWPDDPGSWIAFFLMGITALTGHNIMSAAYRYAPASTLAPFSYIQIVYYSILSWLLFNQPPDMWIFIGAPIVIASGVYIWWRERRLSLLGNQA